MKTNKEKELEKWKTIIESIPEEKKGWLEQYAQQHSLGILSNANIPPETGTTDGFSEHFSSLLPIAMKVSAHTIGAGGTRKSKAQQLRENRLNKLRQLDGKKPNIVLPDDEKVPGLVSVQPLSAPSGQLLYMDFKYSDIKKDRRMKLEQIEKNQKILQILEMLKNNI